MNRYELENLLLTGFGRRNVTIKKAAELLAIDMFANGKDICGYADNKTRTEWWEGKISDEEILSSLSKQVSIFEKKILAAVENKQLKTIICKKNFDEKIIIESVRIDLNDFYQWLLDHDYLKHGYIFEVHDEKQLRLLGLLENYADFLLKADDKTIDEVNGIDDMLEFIATNQGKKLESDDINVILTQYRTAIFKIHELNEDIKLLESDETKTSDKPLSHSERRSLQNIIVALMEVIEGKAPGIAKHPSFKSRSELFNEISKSYEGYYGLSKSNLERKIPEAERSFKGQ